MTLTANKINYKKEILAQLHKLRQDFPDLEYGTLRLSLLKGYTMGLMYGAADIDNMREIFATYCSVTEHNAI